MTHPIGNPYDSMGERIVSSSVTTKESEVDVLAVMDEAHDWLYRSSECLGDDQRAANVKQARAAVAEVFEALQGALKTAEFEKHPFRPWHARARTALRNAGVKV